MTFHQNTAGVSAGKLHRTKKTFLVGTLAIAVASALGISPVIAAPDVVIGPGTNATTQATASAGNNIVISAFNTTNTVRANLSSVAIGLGVTQANDNSVALGNNSQALGQRTVAIGINAIAPATAGDSVVIGDNASAFGQNTTVIGNNAKATAGSNNTAFGANTTVSGIGGVAIGQTSIVAGDFGTGLGSGSTASGKNSTAVGGTTGSGSAPRVTASGDGSVAIGAAAGTTAAGGGGANASGVNAIAIGGRSVSGGLGAVSLGNQATAANANDVALGAFSVTGAQSAGPFTLNGDTAAIAGQPVAGNGVVSVGGGVGKERQIQNVAAGSVAINSTDAINGSQLFAVGSSVNNLGNTTAAALGGGSTFDPNTGNVTAPVINLQGAAAPFNNVTSALESLANGTAGQLQNSTPDAPSNSLKLVGPNAGAAVTLTNLEDGNAPSDAVNFGQLSKVQDQTTGLANGSAGLIQYATPGTPSNNMKLVGADGSAPVVLSGIADGKETNDAVNFGQLSSVSDLATKAGNGFTLATSQSTGIATGAAASVKPGDTFTVDAGNNIVLTQDATKLTIATSATPTFTSVTTDSVTAGNSKLDNSGLTITGGPSVTDQGIDAGGKKISNVAPATTTGDVVNFEQLRDVAQRGAQGIAPVQYSAPATPSTPTPDGSISNDATLVGADKAKPVVLHNVGEGKVESGSTDAVNGGQTFVSLQSAADALGGGASVGKDGQLTSPSYRVGGQSYSNVGSAFGAVDRSIGKLQNDVAENRKEARRGIAGTAAMANLTFNNVPDTMSTSLAVGGYKNQQALAAGVRYTLSNNLRLQTSLSLSTSGGSEGTWGAGIGYDF